MDALYAVVRNDYDDYEYKPTHKNTLKLRKSLLLLKKMCDEERKRILIISKELKAKKKTKQLDDKKSNE